MAGGIYIAVFHLHRARSIRVGRLGRFDFPVGFYFYVGSAQRGLDARLARHARRRKVLRWHVDYLSSRATMLGAWVLQAGKSWECGVAGVLGEHYEQIAPGFGASDCRCGGHLFHRRIV